MQINVAVAAFLAAMLLGLALKQTTDATTGAGCSTHEPYSEPHTELARR
jgi:hypothetical protein